MMSAEKDWIDILQALLTPTIAVAAVAITLFQARVNYLRFRHEMFDRRYEMYLAVRRFMREVVAIGFDIDRTRREYDDLKKQYLDAIDGAPFVFSERIDEYFLEILEKAEKCLGIQRRFRTLGSSENTGAIDTAGDCLDWFRRQLGSAERHSELDEHIGRYLRLHQV